MTVHYSNQFPTSLSRSKVKSKTHGNLLLDGLIVEYNRPYAILQAIKREKYSHVKGSRLKIVSVIL